MDLDNLQKNRFLKYFPHRDHFVFVAITLCMYKSRFSGLHIYDLTLFGSSEQ